jgi:hypothetical protein
MALSAHDPQDRVDQLLALTESLTGRLAAEATAFEARRPLTDTFALEETARLANLYRHECARVRMDPSLIAGSSLSSRQKLAQATQAFEQMLERHARWLQAAKTVTEGLVRTIAGEVAAGRAPGAGYGASGHAATGDARAVTLNRRA